MNTFFTEFTGVYTYRGPEPRHCLLAGGFAHRCVFYVLQYVAVLSTPVNKALHATCEVLL